MNNGGRIDDQPPRLQKRPQSGIPPPGQLWRPTSKHSSEQSLGPEREFGVREQRQGSSSQSQSTNQRRLSSLFSFKKDNTNASTSSRPSTASQASLNMYQQQPERPPMNGNHSGNSFNSAHQPRQQMQAPPQQQFMSHQPESQLQPQPQQAEEQHAPPQPPQPPPLHPELRSFVSLSFAHVHKIYFSGQLVRKVERNPDGHRPKDDQWSDVWGQLGGTTLSIWDMKEIELANKEGREVPPSYVNVTDAFVSVLGSITVPAQGNQPPKRYTNVLTINTAGSNLLLFACPDATALVSWAAALRLASWEKSRLEEIYTAHLLRMTLSDGGAWKEPRTTLIKGQMEGWAQIRVAGQTEWKRVWMVLSSASQAANSAPDPNLPAPSMSKRRISSLFSGGAGGDNRPPIIKSSIAFHTSQKTKDKRRAWLTLYDVTQAFAVYPERPEMISKSTLVKVEGLMSDEEGAGNMRGREAWVLVMPEIEHSGGKVGVMEMLKWIVGFHDAFDLYGRPRGYTWDPRDSISMMFAYPFGPLKDHLFLDRELAENMDPREERTSVIRSRLLNVLVERMQAPPDAPSNGQSQSGHHIGGPRNGQSLLTPITERSSIPTRENTIDGHLDALSSPSDGDLMRTVTSIMGSSSSQSPIPGASLQGGIPDPATQAGMAPVSAVQPQDPAPPIRASQSFEPQLSSIPSNPSSGASSPKPGPRDAGPTPKSPLGPSRVPQVDIARQAPTVDSSTLSPQSFARSLWSDGPPTNENKPNGVISGMTSPGSNPAGSQSQTAAYSNGPSSAAWSGSGGSVDPPSTYSGGTQSPSQSAQQQKYTSPVSQDGPSPTARYTSPQGATATSGAGSSSAQGASSSQQATPQLLPARQSPRQEESWHTAQPGRSIDPPYAGPPAPLQMDRAPEKRQTPQAPELSPQESYHSYPAGAEHQTPDLYEPQPRASRASHTVLQLNPNVTGSSEAAASPVKPTLPKVPAYTAGPATPTQRQEVNLVQEPTLNQVARPPLPGPPPPTSTPPANMSGSYHGHDDEYGSRQSSLMTSTGSMRMAPTSGVQGVRASQVQVQRRPSGARAPPVKKGFISTAPSVDLHSLREDSPQQPLPAPSSYASRSGPSGSNRGMVNSEIDDYGPDALAALSLVDQIDQPRRSIDQSAVNEFGAVDRRGSPAYPSSFSNNKTAERKAKAQAQQAQIQAAASKPGRTNGKAKKKVKAQGGWGQESSEEEEEEDDDDDDEGSDGPTPAKARQAPSQAYQQNYGSGSMPASSSPAYDARRGTPPDARRGTPPTGRPLPSPDNGGQQRPRNLPPAPGGSRGSGSVPRYNDHDDGGYGGRNTQYDRQSPRPLSRPNEGQAQRGRDPPQQLKPSMWSQALDPNATNVGPGSRDTFIRLDDENETMTKVFAPQGLLHAGLQDKHDRSAKRQEEMARESGTSLINVPGKPLDPQTGLLGAVTAHERDRKGEGGVGAKLTKKLADEREAEERQRKIDELQRQQLAQMGHGGGGSVYDGGMGQYPNPAMSPAPFGYNPMMLNPMMMGNPMMGMGWGMPGMNPQQQMMAAQAAAEAYQRAMVSFSQAGSQAPSEAGDVSPAERAGATSPMPMGMMSPMMTGGSMMMNPMMMGMMPMGGGMNPAMMGHPGMMGGHPGMMSGNPSMMGGNPGMMGGSGMYPGYYSGAPTPTSEAHNFQNRMTGNYDGLPPDRSAAQSQQSNRGASPLGKPQPN